MSDLCPPPRLLLCGQLREYWEEDDLRACLLSYRELSFLVIQNCLSFLKVQRNGIENPLSRFSLSFAN
jgi:hypothetical protein